MKKIVFITSRNIFPCDSGDKLHSLNIIKELHKICDLTLINLLDEGPYCEETEEKLSHYCNKLIIIPYTHNNKIKSIINSIWTWIPIAMCKRQNKSVKEKIKGYINKTIIPEIIIWDHLRTTSFWFSNKFLNILFEHNNELKIIENQTEYFRKRSYFVSKFYFFQAFLMKRYLHRIYSVMDKVIFVSNYDIKELKVIPKNYDLLEFIILNFEHDRYIIKKQPELFRILFVGSLDWYPNIEAVQWFVNNILKEIKDQKIEFVVVGKDPDKALTKLCTNNTQIKLFKNVISVEPYFLESDLFINPLFNGAGINIKIYEALSYGIPIISTSFGMRGYTNHPIPIFENRDQCLELINKTLEYDYRMILGEECVKYYNDYKLASKNQIYKFINI